ncbi:hypothetical protein [Fluviispira vulneris]|uniref:hypothetical protein n=1 Tax=Fluviispira vulneris TaxID=2763012 RepID=UPI0016469C28|nr:hypothetical protein [Fluviispira vulneris]
MGINYVINKGIAAVKNELIDILAREIKKDYVHTSWDNNDLIIEIKKMGSSKINIAFKEIGNEVRINEVKRNIAMMHKPFTAEVEKMVDDILVNKLGAKRA